MDYKSHPFHTVIRIHLISLSYHILVVLPSHFSSMEQMWDCVYACSFAIIFFCALLQTKWVDLQTFQIFRQDVRVDGHGVTVSTRYDIFSQGSRGGHGVQFWEKDFPL